MAILQRPLQVKCCWSECYGQERTIDAGMEYKPDYSYCEDTLSPTAFILIGGNRYEVRKADLLDAIQQ